MTPPDDDGPLPGDASGRESSTVVGTETGLEENVAGALSYLLGLLTGILFYLLEDENSFVRFRQHLRTPSESGPQIVLE